MKRKVILVSRSVVCVLLIGCTAFSVYSLKASQTNGGYSDVCGRISPEAREWIIEQFGDCPCFEELLRRIDIFAIENFKYEDLPLFMGCLQLFDLDKFLFGKDKYKGVCFDFACWVKSCVLVWSDEHGIDVNAFVIEVKGKDYAHSFNVFYYNKRTYSLDVTWDNSRARKGTKPIGPLFCGDASMEQIAEHRGEKVMRWG